MFKGAAAGLGFEEIMDKELRYAINLPLGCAAHSTSASHRRRNINVYLAFTMTRGCQPISKSLFYPSPACSITSATPEEWKAWMTSAGNRKQETGAGCTREPAPSPTALPSALKNMRAKFWKGLSISLSPSVTTTSPTEFPCYDRLLRSIARLMPRRVFATFTVVSLPFRTRMVYDSAHSEGEVHNESRMLWPRQ